MQNLQMELLQLLKEDCRLPLEQLATMTGASLEAVADSIQIMEKSGVILRYSPVINWDKTDRERVEAMIEVR
ncbi:MAG: Lrp/AsnC family transcriptional regulator, partial [Clostridia bacterium]